ncbi:hypothetical protein [Lacunimicrobium album]
MGIEADEEIFLQQCLDAGANDDMAKPLDVEKLMSLIQVWIGR